MRPKNSEMTALGAAIAAGIADGISVWNLNNISIPVNKIFNPSIDEQGINILINKHNLV